MNAERAVALALTPDLLSRLRGVLAQVADPEIPVLSVLDLGVIRHLKGRPDGRIEVGIAPTYSGCPATSAIKSDVIRALNGAGFDAVAIDVLTPPWTTDWISTEGRRKLEAFGIAAPAEAGAGKRRLWQADPEVSCPRCGSERTAKQSEFGSTPCKALYKCESCFEPFDYFKCI